MDAVLLQKTLIYFALIFGAGLLWYFSTKRGGKTSSSASAPSKLKNLTELARAGKLDAVVGREEEIDRVINIIQRRLKNNPLLLGEPGVGKTAIVEGLAMRIANKQVPNALRGKQILELNVGELISGTKYRGEFEERLRQVTQELEKIPRSTILFIDEIHLLEQTKGTEGALSASDILKPALARGDLSVIGATTFQEYEEYIRPNTALDRRFQPVLVNEPSQAAALAILRGVAKLYEAHHDVIVDDSALEAAVELTAEVLKDRRLPDKALDVIDEACAKVAVEASGAHAVRIGLVHAAAEAARKRAHAEEQGLDRELEHVEDLDKKFPGDPAIMSVESTLKKHIQELESVMHQSVEDESRPRVLREDVEEVVNAWKTFGKKESSVTVPARGLPPNK